MKFERCNFGLFVSYPNLGEQREHFNARYEILIYIFNHVLGIDLDDNNIIDMKYLYYMMNINFYVKSMRSFIILSVM